MTLLNPRKSIVLVLSGLFGLVFCVGIWDIFALDSVPIEISFTDNRSLTIFIDSPSSISINGLRFVTTTNGVNTSYPLDTFFPELIKNRQISAGACLVLERIVEPRPPVPTKCTNEIIKQTIGNDDIFWHNFVSNGYIPFNVYENSQLVRISNSEQSSCSPPDETCRYDWIPRITTVETTSILPIDVSNLGEPQYKDIAGLKDNLTLDDWSAFSGKDIRVGVIEQHFSGLDSLAGQLNPITLTTKQEIASYNDDNFTQGTNVIEVIHNLAPNAELFPCRYASYTEFTECTEWMFENDIQIIHHSAHIPVFGVNGESDWAAEVAKAKDEGILWIDAAGNYANSRYEDNFEDDDSDGFVEFRLEENDEILPLNAISYTSGTIMLTWSDRNLPANAIDLDLKIIDLDTLQPIAFSENRQLGLGGNRPVEIVTIEMTEEFGIQIIDHNGMASDSSTEFALFVEFADLDAWSTDQTITAPSSSPFALTVGSLQGALVAPYTSRGALRNKSSIEKPDIVAPGEIQLLNGTRFVGTSASASVVTGFAALVWENLNVRAEVQFGEGSVAPREDVWDYLRTEAVIPKFALYDVDYGYGYLQPPPPDLVLPIHIVSAEVMPELDVSGEITPEVTPEAISNDIFSPISSTPELELPLAIINVPAANLRLGPGLRQDILSAAFKDDEFTILSQSSDENWYLIARPSLSPLWIADSVVDVTIPAELDIPYAEFSTIVPSPTRQATPISTPIFLPSPQPPTNYMSIAGSIQNESPPRPILQEGDTYITIIHPPSIPPSLSFIVDESDELPMTITLNNLSAGDVRRYEWDFDGDGIIDSTQPNPTFTYARAGSYTVSLYGVYGNNKRTSAFQQSVTIQPQPPKASFTASLSSGTAPLTVQFTDTSVGDITVYEWDFDGDGTPDHFSSESTSFTYESAGTYIVKLTVSNSNHSDTYTQTITVNPPVAETPEANFSPIPLAGVAPLNVTFRNTSTGDITAYKWDFDSDGTIDSRDMNPTHNYTVVGTYNAILTVSDADENSDTKIVSIIVEGESAPTDTPTPTTVSTVLAKVNNPQGVNVRHCPGTQYIKKGSALTNNTEKTLIAKDSQGNWYQFDDGWIAGFTGSLQITGDISTLPVVTPTCGLSITDIDEDGKTDDVDACPDQAADTADGCPIVVIAVVDTDGDGVPDSIDQCPTQGDQGLGVDANGCPNQPPMSDSDTDGDGYADSVDVCPTQGNQGHGVDGNGCPNQPPVGDSDGDGFADNVDSCPSRGDEGNGVDSSGCPNPEPLCDSKINVSNGAVLGNVNSISGKYCGNKVGWLIVRTYPPDNRFYPQSEDASQGKSISSGDWSMVVQLGRNGCPENFDLILIEVDDGSSADTEITNWLVNGHAAGFDSWPGLESLSGGTTLKTVTVSTQYAELRDDC